MDSFLNSFQLYDVLRYRCQVTLTRRWPAW